MVTTLIWKVFPRVGLQDLCFPNSSSEVERVFPHLTTAPGWRDARGYWKGQRAGQVWEQVSISLSQEHSPGGSFPLSPPQAVRAEPEEAGVWGGGGCSKACPELSLCLWVQLLKNSLYCSQPATLSQTH